MVVCKGDLKKHNEGKKSGMQEAGKHRDRRNYSMTAEVRIGLGEVATQGGLALSLVKCSRYRNPHKADM